MLVRKLTQPYGKIVYCLTPFPFRDAADTLSRCLLFVPIRSAQEWKYVAQMLKVGMDWNGCMGEKQTFHGGQRRCQTNRTANDAALLKNNVASLPKHNICSLNNTTVFIVQTATQLWLRRPLKVAVEINYKTLCPSGRKKRDEDLCMTSGELRPLQYNLLRLLFRAILKHYRFTIAMTQQSRRNRTCTWDKTANSKRQLLNSPPMQAGNYTALGR